MLFCVLTAPTPRFSIELPMKDCVALVEFLTARFGFVILDATLLLSSIMEALFAILFLRLTISGSTDFSRVSYCRFG